MRSFVPLVEDRIQGPRQDAGGILHTNEDLAHDVLRVAHKHCHLQGRYHGSSAREPI